MWKITIRLLLIKYLLVMCFLFATMLQAHTTETLIFGTYAFERPTTTVKKLRPILDALENRLQKRLGRTIKIKLQIARDYHTAVQDLVEGRVDFGRYGQAVYVISKRENTDLQILAVEGDGKKKTFQSVVIVRKNSRIQNLTDLVGKSFAFGSLYSTTGRYFPQEFLAKRGITADKLSKYTYLQRHDRVGWAVSDGNYDAGAISRWVYEDMIAQGAAIRPIASFANVTKPWVARKGLAEDVQTAIRKSLIKLRDVKVLGLIKKDCFLPGSDEDYDSVRTTIANNKLFFNRS